MLVYLDLLIHIEIGQPVIHHDDGVDVIERISRFSGYAVPNLHRIAFACSVSQDGKFVSGFQFRFPDELPDHIRRHVPVDRIYYPDFIRFEIILSSLYHLWNAERLPILSGQLSCNIQAVSRTREIQDDAFLPFPSQDVSENNPDEAIAALAMAVPIRFRASRRDILLFALIYI